MVDTKKAFADATPEDRERNRARAHVSRSNISTVRKRLDEIAAELWNEYNEADDQSAVLHPNAALLYALVGYPWIEYEDGDIERVEERFRGSAAKYFEAPDLSWIIEDEDPVITLQELTLDENENPIPVEDEEGKTVNKTHDIEIPLADAIRIYGLGFKPNGTTAKSGLEVEWLLTRQPGVGKSRAIAIIEASGIRPETKLGSLYRVQYYDLLIQSGAEEVDGDEAEAEGEVDEFSDDLDAAAEEFDDDADAAEEDADEVDADEVDADEVDAAEEDADDDEADEVDADEADDADDADDADAE